MTEEFLHNELSHCTTFTYRSFFETIPSAVCVSDKEEQLHLCVDLCSFRP